MSAEKIIEQIKKDSEKEIKVIKKESEKEIKDITETAKNKAKKEAEKIKEQGKNQAENEKKIMISQENQESNKKLMNAREEMINKCFDKAIDKLSKLNKKDYQNISEKLLKNGMEKITGEKKVFIARTEDKEIAKKLRIPVAGEIDSTGGVIVSSKDGKITIDNTLHGIINREKQVIRNKVGKVLFS